jgi:hypothetical protein
MKIFLYVFFVFMITNAGTSVDTFGILKFFPTKAGTREWNSAHWNNGIPRTFMYAPDSCDPTGWTEDHSGGTDGFRVDGAGIMEMSGSGPRFHVNSLLTSKVAAQKFCNVEFTAYYRRKGTQGLDWGGMIVGLRSGPLGHASPGGNVCDATTYYGRFRNDGKWDFEKELKHPGSTYWSGSGYNTQDPLWHGATLPLNRWIGMKYIAFNIKNNTQVRLQLYIDSVSNGNPQNGGRWEKVGEVVDAGNWPSGDVSGCSYTNTMAIIEGGGTMLLRTDNDTADYKMVSIREIDTSTTATAQLSRKETLSAKGFSIVRKTSGFEIIPDKAVTGPVTLELFDLQGRIIEHGAGENGKNVMRMKIPAEGIYMLRVRYGRMIKLNF